LLKHNKEEPIVIGPGGIVYITDHHHLARALYDVGASQTYCTIVDNLSDAKPDDFWKPLEENNEVYLKNQNGNPIPPRDLPASVKDLSNNPFRSLAGAVRQLRVRPGRCSHAPSSIGIGKWNGACIEGSFAGDEKVRLTAAINGYRLVFGCGWRVLF
jgi:hypothetical protein